MPSHSMIGRKGQKQHSNLASAIVVLLVECGDFLSLAAWNVQRRAAGGQR
jgi:hypothetical protein